ncbi:GFA family protein [Paracoccus laeviglucosivorans]|nr:GFA family protein [Paracoccus laeviglucosivorans]
MPQPVLPAEGGCRCGALRIRIDAGPIMTAACHCKGCQRMTGSAFSLTAMIPSPGFRVLQGEPVQGGLRDPVQQHMFCPHCLSWVFTRIAGMDDFVNLRATMLDDAQWFQPFIETFTAEKLAWATVPARHSFEGFPPPESYGPLMAEFAAA